MNPYFYPIASALVLGLMPTVAKLGLSEGMPPLQGTLFGTFAAIPLYVLVLMALGKWKDLWRIDQRSLVFLAASGGCSSLALLFMFTALSLGAVSIVVVISNAIPFFNLLFVFAFLRGERITGKVLLGNLAIVTGLVLAAIA